MSKLNIVVYMDGELLDFNETTRKIAYETIKGLISATDPETARRKGW
jgi:hypothetical protein